MHAGTFIALCEPISWLCVCVCVIQSDMINTRVGAQLH